MRLTAFLNLLWAIPGLLRSLPTPVVNMTFCCDWGAPPAKLNIAGAAALLSTGVKLNPPGVEAKGKIFKRKN